MRINMEGTKICSNGKKWGTNNSYKKDSYRRKMSTATYKGKKTKDKDGYLIIRVRKPGNITMSTVKEHIYVVEQSIGRKLKKGEMIHHINGVRDDNRIENLHLCAGAREHSVWEKVKKYFEANPNTRVDENEFYGWLKARMT